MLEKSRLQKLVNRSLDTLVRPEVRLFGSHCAFKLCGGVGFFVAVTFVTWLCALERRSILAMTVLFVSSVLTFLALAMATKIVADGERLVLYHSKLAVLSVAALILWALSLPMFAYLDLLIIGVVTFISFGRIGCLLVGCCHGRLHTWGVAYRGVHADLGFPRHLVGVRLFPIQAVEAIWGMCIVAVGSYTILLGNSRGSAFSSCAIAYAGGRFCFEFLRGDADRPHWAGFSEAQWTSVGIAVLIVAAEISGLLPLRVWNLIAGVCVVVLLLTVAIVRATSRLRCFELTHPQHILELARAVENISHCEEAERSDNRDVKVSCTSLGVLISGIDALFYQHGLCHYSVSFQDRAMDIRSARVLAKLICRLRGFSRPAKVVTGEHAIYHLIFQRSEFRPF